MSEKNAGTLPKVSVLGTGVTAVGYDAVAERLLSLAGEGGSHAVTASAVHLVMEAYHDSELRAALARFEVVTPDGQPVRWGVNLLGPYRLSERVTGPELTLRLCELAAARGVSVYLYGSAEAVVTTLQRRLLERYPALIIAGVQPSRFRPLTDEEDAADVAAINASGAGIVFVGLGCPRQERWAAAHLGRVKGVMVCVGAAFDFHAGLLPRAPAWMGRAGLEWVYRLAMEPRRLFWRYAKHNPAYLALLCAQWLGVARFPPPKPEA